MSILNVDKVQPIGGGSTITVDATDIQATSATITASKFVGSGDLSITGVSTFTGTIHANETGDAKGIRIHSNGGISATNNELRFNTGQSNGFTFKANSDGGSSNERLRIASDGKIGIGTVATHSFEIFSGADHQNIMMVKGTNTDGNYAGVGVYQGNAWFTGGGIGSNSTGIVFRTAASGSETERLRITSDGKIGIGGESSPEFKVTVYDAGYSGVTLKTNRNTATDNIGGLHFKTRTTNVAYIQSLVDGTIKFRNTSGLGERLRINTTGQIITNGGSANPYPTRTATFQPASGQTNCYISIVAGNSSSVSGLTFGDDADNQPGNYAGMFEYRHNIDTLAYMQNGSDRVRIASDGDLTIVGSDNAELKLLCGSSSGNDIIAFQNSAGATRGNITYDSDNNFLFFNVNQGERFRITSGGSVGINETSPDRKLHVRSDGAAAAKLGGESGAAYYMEIGQLASSGSPGFNATGTSTSMLFQLNGSEKVRIDSSGRLLVATNSASGTNSGADDLVIGNTSQGNNGMSIVTNNANIGAIFFADQDNAVRGGVRYQHASDLAQFYAGGSVILNLKNKGVGINETSPTEDALVIRGGDTDDTPSLILKRHTDGIQNDGEVIGRIQFMSNENNVDSGNHHTRAEIRAETQSTSGASRLEFYTVPNSTIATALAATINGTQDFMIGTQNPDEGGAGLGFNARGFVYRPSGHAVVRSASTSISGASGICYTAKFADTGTGKAFRVMLAQTEIGSIGMGAGGTTFNTSSDYRRKENIINLTGAITRLKTLTPKRFNFKDEPSVTRDGFLAHEVTAVPEAITGTKDQVDSNNDPVYQQMDQSKLVPLLVAALQEAVARIEALEGS